MTQQPYTYTTLRYVHDVRTGEFLNVGIVLCVPDTGCALFRNRKTYGRAKAVFPDLDGDAFRDAMSAVDRALTKVVRAAASGGRAIGDAISFARMALPADDSTLQWSPVGSGVTDDPAKALDRLYKRLVVRYDASTQPRRSDADVWRPVRDKINQRNIKIVLEEKVVAGTADKVTFKHAWRNGLWHAYEAVSLDLADSEGIKDKARRWRGHLDAVASGAQEKLKVNFIVGAPKGNGLHAAYRNALAILRQAEFQPKVFEENQTDQLVDEIEDEFRTHSRVRD